MAFVLYLPVEGVEYPCPDYRWRLVYRRGAMTLPVEVCAPDEETAIMRGGMKRAEMLRLEKAIFPGCSRVKWERESVERI
jgi:hypothetical protein